MKTLNNKKSYSLLTAIFLVATWLALPLISFSQEGENKPWTVPDKSKNIANPVKSSEESIATGKNLYNKHCKSCHGAKGLGDGPKSQELKTPSGDFSIKEFQSQTDGEIFYKAKEGRDDMPSFKKKIQDDDDIWSIINFVRTLGSDETKKK